MASAEEQLCRKSGETAASLNGAHYPSSCTEQPDFGCAEDLREFPDPLEEVDVVKSRDQPAIMGTDSEAFGSSSRALDLMFPREDRDDDWSDERDVDDIQVIDGNNEKDGSGSEVASDCSTEEGSDEDDDCNQVRDKGETDCPGKYYSRRDAKKIERRRLNSYSKQVGYYANLHNEIMARGEENTLNTLPPYPLFVLPDATPQCTRGGNCYHRVFKTYDTSATESALGYRTPEEMLQFFSLCLSSFYPSHPVSVYGIFAVRDELDKRRNYIFNRPRDDAVVIEKKDSFALPLCSPCRGIYVHNRALLEVDLWLKTEGDVSDDKQLLSAYAEVDIRGSFDGMRYARIIGDACNLDIEYNALAHSLETVIQVYAKVDHPHHLRFTALSNAYDGSEIVLFDDKLFGDAKFIQYIAAVKANEKLDVLLKVDHSLFQWSFQDEHVGAVHSPDDSIFDYGQFLVRVLFAPKDFQ